MVIGKNGKNRTLGGTRQANWCKKPTRADSIGYVGGRQAIEEVEFVTP